jgi:hypothetical protein
MPRTIIFNGYDSWSDKGLMMSGATPLSDPTAKISALEIELSDGYVDTSRIDCNLHYGPREITYAFAQTIPVYDDRGRAHNAVHMNKLCVEAIRAVQSWFHGNTNRRLYDTAYCNPATQTGYYFDNAMCTSFKSSKSIGDTKWVIAYQVTFRFNPYLIEYTANPTKFVLFGGPTEDAVGMNQMAVRIYNKGTNQRMMWVNDNNTQVDAIKTGGDSSTFFTARITFVPPAKEIYSGPVGFYLNHYMDFTLNNVLYKYRINAINVQDGNVTFVESDKLVTPNEMGYTDQAGFQFDVSIYPVEGTASLDTMLAQNDNKFPFSLIWGTATVFDTPLDQPYIVLGHVKGDQTFQQVTGHDASTIEYVTRNFGDTFTLDDDQYNELLMSTSNYGFYELDNPDVLRRSL